MYLTVKDTKYKLCFIKMQGKNFQTSDKVTIAEGILGNPEVPLL